MQDFPGGPVVKNPPANAEDTGLISVQKDSMCHRAIEPMRQALEPKHPRTHAPQQEKLPQ